jgi:hypothetical protein
MCEGTPEELDEVGRWKYQRWKLTQLLPAFKPADFDAMEDAPWWLRDFIDVKRYELNDCVAILNAQKRAKRKPETR